MKDNFIKLTICCLAVLLLLSGTICVFAKEDTVNEAKNIVDGIVAQKDSDFFTENAGIGAEWYVIALRQYGRTDFAAYEASLLSYLENTQVHSASSRQKYALALLAVGSDDGYIQNTMNDSIGQQGVMSWVFGLHLMHNGQQSETYTADQVKEQLLSLQLADGGWAVMGTNSDVDVTAMTVQALAPYYAQDVASKNAIDKALTLLSERQLEDGDYASYGVGNPESTAQVMIALSSLGIDCTQDSRFIKAGKNLFDGIAKYRLEDGSYCHQEGGTSNETATVQVLCAMVSYVRMANGQSGLYLFDTAESVPETTQESTPAPTTAPATATIPQETDAPRTGSYKPWVCLGLAVAGGMVCLFLFLAKKRHVKNFIAVLLVVALACGVVCVTDFQTADSYYNGTENTKENGIGTVTMTIRCDTVAGKTDSQYIPKDGVILPTTEFEIAAGDTVFTILTEAARNYEISMEYSGTETMAYVSGIQYLYELDFGDLSGWVYHVNGEAPSVGCGEYALQDGDRIEWLYTCALGNDLE